MFFNIVTTGELPQDARVVSSIPPCLKIKTPLVSKATGNHLLKSPVSILCCARNRICDAYFLYVYDARKLLTIFRQDLPLLFPRSVCRKAYPQEGEDGDQNAFRVNHLPENFRRWVKQQGNLFSIIRLSHLQ